MTITGFSRPAFLAGVTSALMTSAFAPPAGAADPIPLRVGGSATDSTAELFYGHDLGFYAKDSLDVQLTLMRNTGALAAAQAGGAIDITTGSIVPIAQATSRGLDLRAFAPGCIYNGAPTDAVIIVAADSKFATAADLNGKTFAVNGLRDLTHLAVLSWVDAKGGDWKSIKVLEVPFPEAGAALAAGRVDAALSVEPFASALHGKVRVLGDAFTGIGKTFLITGWFATQPWLAGHQLAARRFAETTLKIAAWANAHRDESATILARYTPMSLDTIRSMGRATYAQTPLTAALMQPVLDALTKYFGMQAPSGGDLLWNA